MVKHGINQSIIFQCKMILSALSMFHDVSCVFHPFPFEMQEAKVVHPLVQSNLLKAPSHCQFISRLIATNRTGKASQFQALAYEPSSAVRRVLVAAIAVISEARRVARRVARRGFPHVQMHCSRYSPLQ